MHHKITTTPKKDAVVLYKYKYNLIKNDYESS